MARLAWKIAELASEFGHVALEALEEKDVGIFS
jgi:hypothetical protein